MSKISKILLKEILKKEDKFLFLEREEIFNLIDSFLFSIYKHYDKKNIFEIIKKENIDPVFNKNEKKLLNVLLSVEVENNFFYFFGEKFLKRKNKNKKKEIIFILFPLFLKELGKIISNTKMNQEIFYGVLYFAFEKRIKK